MLKDKIQSVRLSRPSPTIKVRRMNDRFHVRLTDPKEKKEIEEK